MDDRKRLKLIIQKLNSRSPLLKQDLSGLSTTKDDIHILSSSNVRDLDVVLTSVSLFMISLVFFQFIHFYLHNIRMITILVLVTFDATLQLIPVNRY